MKSAMAGLKPRADCSLPYSGYKRATSAIADGAGVLVCGSSGRTAAVLIEA